jgi:hypothetical protein
LRQGSYFPDWLLERRRRGEAALVTVVATSYLLGVSTRRMERLVETLGSRCQMHYETLSSCVYAGERADNWAPAKGLEPLTCRLTEGLSRRKSRDPMTVVSRFACIEAGQGLTQPF